jgi:hypothetical protein
MPRLILMSFIFDAALIHCVAVGITVKSRRVTVKGPRGSLDRDFRHIDFDLSLVRLRASCMRQMRPPPPTSFIFALACLCNSRVLQTTNADGSKTLTAEKFFSTSKQAAGVQVCYSFERV